jgi:hypothetical protein
MLTLALAASGADGSGFNIPREVLVLEILVAVFVIALLLRRRSKGD